MKHFLVTGCQRSGTRFYANYLAEQNNLIYIDEKAYGYRDYKRLKKLLTEPCSIHGPSLKYRVLDFKKDYPDSLVVWMYRDLKECRDSMKKVSWNPSYELERIGFGLSFEDAYTRVIMFSREMGLDLFRSGYVDQVINMRSIEHLSGFKKNMGVKKLA